MPTKRKPKRTGFIQCGQCGKNIIVSMHDGLFYCPDSLCINSEEGK